MRLGLALLATQMVSFKPILLPGCGPASPALPGAGMGFFPELSSGPALLTCWLFPPPPSLSRFRLRTPPGWAAPVHPYSPGLGGVSHSLSCILGCYQATSGSFATSGAGSRQWGPLGLCLQVGRRSSHVTGTRQGHEQAAGQNLNLAQAELQR